MPWQRKVAEESVMGMSSRMMYATTVDVSIRHTYAVPMAPVLSSAHTNPTGWELVNDFPGSALSHYRPLPRSVCPEDKPKWAAAYNESRL